MIRCYSLFIFLLLSFNTLTATCFPSKIATFNIQNFGKSKMAKKDVTDTLTDIIRHFDIVAVQELSDISNETPTAFLSLINRTGLNYGLACSPRTGTQPDDTPSAEQYAFYYNKDKFIVLDADLYDDSSTDLFQREPWIVKFQRRCDGLIFCMCTIHTMPKRAVQEIDALYEVTQWIPQRFHVSQNIIICGDFNASCSYASSEELQALKIHQTPFYWIVPDNAKTNLSKKECAYDRFVVTRNIQQRISKWEVYQYFRTKAVSDHWPVYIEMK